MNPDVTYSDDPLRMMRAIRFAAQLDFRIEEQSLKSITRNREQDIDHFTGKDHRRTEQNNGCPQPSSGFRLLDKTGLLPLILPEVSAMKGVEEKEGKGHKDNFHHSLKVLDNLSAKER